MTLAEKLKLLFKLYDLSPKTVVEIAKEAGLAGVTEATVKGLLEHGDRNLRKVDRLVLAVISIATRTPINIVGNETFEEVLKYMPPMSGSYDTLLSEGKNKARGGHYLKANRFFHSAAIKAENEEQKALAYHNMAQCFLSLGVYDLAEEMAQEAQKLLFDITKHWETSFLLVRILVNSNQINMARLLTIGLYDMASTDGQRADVASMKALLESYAGRNDNAVEQIELAIRGYNAAANRLKEVHSIIRRGYYEFLRSGSAEQLDEMKKAHREMVETGADMIDRVMAKNMILRVLMKTSPAKAREDLDNLLVVCEEWEFWDAYFYGKVTLHDAAAGESERKSHLDDIVKVWPKLSSWNPDLERFKGILEEKEDT